MANFGSQMPGSDILASYAKATRLSPISTTDKNAVLKDYGIAAGWAKGKSDSAISMEAADKVVAKFKADQANPLNNPKPSTPGTGSIPLPKATDPEIRKVTYASQNRQQGETLSKAYSRLYGGTLTVDLLQRLGMYNGPVKNPYTVKASNGLWYKPGTVPNAIGTATTPARPTGTPLSWSSYVQIMQANGYRGLTTEVPQANRLTKESLMAWLASNPR